MVPGMAVSRAVLQYTALSVGSAVQGKLSCSKLQQRRCRFGLSRMLIMLLGCI
jgi:hypothetical protein